MPLPIPYKGESQKDFIARFMADKMMRDEFKAKSKGNQQYAVAIAQWNRRNKKK